jgi:uncharacterized lipoprotein YmbA
MRIKQMRVAAKLLATVGAAVLAGCATSPTATSSYEVDYARVAQVEHFSRMFGSQVVWVNYPLKRSDATR